MQFAHRQRRLGRIWKPLAAALLVGLLLGFAGPFGSYPAFPAATRYAFWVGLTLAGALAGMAANVMMSAMKLQPGATRIIAVTLISAVPMTFIVAWTTSLLQPGRVYLPFQMLALFAAVAAVQLLVVFATGSLRSPRDDPDTSERTTASSADMDDAPNVGFPPALLNRLPPAIGRDIVALETEDHYLRVYTTNGSALILMRMADAVAMLDPRLGMQVHRRWWVAQAAVVDLQAEGQKLSLCLIDRSSVPIGRTFRAAATGRFAGVRSKEAAPSMFQVKG